MMIPKVNTFFSARFLLIHVPSITYMEPIPTLTGNKKPCGYTEVTGMWKSIWSIRYFIYKTESGPVSLLSCSLNSHLYVFEVAVKY